MTSITINTVKLLALTMALDDALDLLEEQRELVIEGGATRGDDGEYDLDTLDDDTAEAVDEFDRTIQAGRDALRRLP
ncbi:MAG: hypothetical protein VB101_07190 [Rhodospirillaceae bacterium]|nr:hypothetical protein [Rhodospirillaceae bacterium]